MRSYVISFRLSVVLLLSCFVLLTACGQSSSPATTIKPTPTPTAAPDFYGTPIAFPKAPPQRIVSLLPNTSEMLGALHLQGRVVAVDYYTTYPHELASLPKVSDVNGKYNVEQIVALKPDLILSWAERPNSTISNLKIWVCASPIFLSRISQGYSSKYCS